MYYISKNKNTILVILAAIVIIVSIIGLVVSVRSKSYASANKNDSYAMQEENKTIDENGYNKKNTKTRLEDLIGEENQDDEEQDDLKEENNSSNLIAFDENGNKVITVYLGEESNYAIINNSTSTARKNVRNIKDNAEVLKKSEKIINILKNDNSYNYQEDYSDLLINEIPINYAYDTEQSNETPEETNNTNQIDNNNYTGVDYSGYFLMVNCTANVVNVYEVDREGNILDCVKVFTCSTGDATPKSGTFKTDYKFRWQPLFGNVYGQYATRIVGNILFHSVPYTENRNNGSLEYEEYDKLGTTASMGCVRLTVEDAKWIYDNCKSGTFVEFYEDENPGPLGKPETMKISGYEGLRNWDPTDPSDDNPWNL